MSLCMGSPGDSDPLSELPDPIDACPWCGAEVLLNGDEASCTGTQCGWVLPEQDFEPVEPNWDLFEEKNV